jgi:predicted NUDIX family NTP pyrophosphohydrolase
MKHSAGLVMYRWRDGGLEVLLVHPGGPFWAAKDVGVWSIPKGACDDGEAELDAARREFTEETGFVAEGEFVELGTVKQSGSKMVSAWAVEGDCDARALKSITCEMEWPPRSGQRLEFPEIDRGEWFSIEEASERMLKGQRPFLEALVEKIGKLQVLPQA